jgi:hypothetical protein
MLGYGYNITIDDRWRIVMYVRSLQRSQNATLADATPDEQTQLDKTKKPPPPPAPAPAPAAPATNAAPATPAASPADAEHSTNGAPASPAKPPGTASDATPEGHPTDLFVTGDHGQMDRVYESAYPTAFAKPTLNSH